MSPPDLNSVRRSISATLDEVVEADQALKAQGIEAVEEGEWLQLRDIVARIERKLAASQKDTAA